MLLTFMSNLLPLKKEIFYELNTDTKLKQFWKISPLKIPFTVRQSLTPYDFIHIWYGFIPYMYKIIHGFIPYMYKIIPM